MAEISTEYLRSQRDSSAVLKVQLARIRGASAEEPVVILEGSDDLIVFDAWITRLAPHLQWSPLPARGKKRVLEFREMVRRDKTGIASKTFFVVDHDYDGIHGQDYGDDIYVLPSHSVENFLASSIVVKSILQTDLHIIGDPRRLNGFVDNYGKFISDVATLLLPACELLRAAVGQECGAVTIREDYVASVAINIEECAVVNASRFGAIVDVERSLPTDVLNRAEEFFREKDLLLWIRGKFLLNAMKAWMRLIENKLRAEVQHKGGGMRVKKFANFTPASLDIRSLAAKAPTPPGLADFLSRVAA